MVELFFVDLVVLMIVNYLLFAWLSKCLLIICCWPGCLNGCWPGCLNGS